MKARVNQWLSTSLLLATFLLVTACAHQPPTEAIDLPGPFASFFLGLFHGFTLFFSLIGSIFWDVEIYAFPNAGFFYDLGYFFGASAFLGGSHAGARQCRPNARR